MASPLYSPNFSASGPSVDLESYDAEVGRRAQQMSDSRRAAQAAAGVPAPVKDVGPRGTPGYIRNYQIGQKGADLFKKGQRALQNPLVRGAGNVLGTVSAANQATQSVTALQEGDYVEGGYRGLRAAADVAATKGNPLAAAFSFGSGAGDVIYANMGRDQQDGVGSVVNSAVRGVGKIFGKDWGADTRAMDALQGVDLRDSVPKLAPAPAPKPDLKNPYANVTPEMAKDIKAANAGAGANPSAPANPSALANPNGLVTRNGNSYSGTNISGDISINGFAPGGGFSSVSGGLASSGTSMPAAPTTAVPTIRSSANDWQSRNDLRNLRVSAESLTNNGYKSDFKGPASPAQLAYAEALKTDNALRGNNDPMALAALKARSDEGNSIRTANSYKYTADQKLRGDMYGSDRQLAASRSNLQYQMAKDQRDYRDQRADKTLEQRRQAAQDVEKYVTRFAPIDKEGKPDPAFAGQFLQFADNYIAKNVETLANSPNPADRELASKLNARGTADLGPDEWRFLKSAWDTRTVQNKTKGMMWGSSTSNGSMVPQDYVAKSVDPGLVDRIENGAGSIAAARLKNPDGDLFSVFPNGGTAAYDRALEEARRQNPLWNQVR